VVIFVDCIYPHLVNIKIGIGAWNNQIKFLITKHTQPFRFHNFKETFSKQTCLLLYLFITLKIGVTHNEIHFVLTK